MSTRACIARATNSDATQWEGVYSHLDGYPTSLGLEIWEILRKDYLTHDVLTMTSCLREWFAQRAVHTFCNLYISGHPGGWSQFPETCYCHDPYFIQQGSVEEMKESYKDVNPFFIEWIYILKSATVSMLILASNGKAFRRAADIDLLGKEPDWRAIENGSYRISRSQSANNIRS